MDKFFEATVQVTPPNHRDAIINMARQANFYESEIGGNEDGFVHFAALVAAAEREVLADWMRRHGFSTGQAYTTESLLDLLGAQMVNNTDAAVLAERESVLNAIDELYKAEEGRHRMFSEGYDLALHHIETFIKAREDT